MIQRTPKNIPASAIPTSENSVDIPVHRLSYRTPLLADYVSQCQKNRHPGSGANPREHSKSLELQLRSAGDDGCEMADPRHVVPEQKSQCPRRSNQR